MRPHHVASVCEAIINIKHKTAMPFNDAAQLCGRSGTKGRLRNLHYMLYLNHWLTPVSMRIGVVIALMEEATSHVRPAAPTLNPSNSSEAALLLPAPIRRILQRPEIPE